GEYIDANGILLDKLQPTFSLAFDKVQAYSDSLHAHAVMALTEAERHIDALLLWLSVILVAALAFSVLLVGATLASTTQAVRALLLVGRQLAPGDLVHRVE